MVRKRIKVITNRLTGELQDFNYREGSPEERALMFLLRFFNRNVSKYFIFYKKKGYCITDMVPSLYNLYRRCVVSI
jgi:hypothetical protein